MRRDVGDLLVVLGMKIIAARVAHQPGTRAVPAIARAPVRHQKQHAVRITVHQPGHRRMRILAARIAQLPRRRPRLLHPGNHLPPDRAMLIRRIDQVEKVRRDAQCQLVVRQPGPGQFLRRERGQQRLELLHRGDAVLQLPAPVIPLRRRDIRPETATGGTESFEGRSGRGTGRLVSGELFIRLHIIVFGL